MKKGTIFIVGLVCAIAPARASITYYCSGCGNAGSQFTSSNLGLTLTGTIGFSSSDLSGGIYTDGTGLEFEGFNLQKNGGTSDTNGTADALHLTVNNYLAQTVNGGVFEITDIPAATFAFAFNLAASGPGGYCVDVNSPSFSQNTYCNATVFVSSSTDVEFFGIASTGSGAVPITNIWIGPQTDMNLSTNTVAQLNNFELEQSTPEPRSMLTFGAGLILIGLVPVRLRRRGTPVARRQ